MSRYEIVINGVTQKVEFEWSHDSQDHTESYDCQIDGERRNSRRLIVLRRTSDLLLVTLDDKMYSLRQKKRSTSSLEFLCNGKTIRVHYPWQEIKEEKRVQSDVASINELVTSNFPAKVVSIRVSKGSKPKDGDTLLVLEAMKMEAQIKAPKNCEVLEVFVQEGDMVSRGTKLVQLEFL